MAICGYILLQRNGRPPLKRTNVIVCPMNSTFVRNIYILFSILVYIKSSPTHKVFG